MKKFKGNKSIKTIAKQCKRLGLQFNDAMFQRGTSDHVVITSIEGDHHSGQVVLNTFNGNFFGNAPDRAPWNGVSFDSTKDEHEHEPWFQALLEFFYTDENERPGPCTRTITPLDRAADRASLGATKKAVTA